MTKYKLTEEKGWAMFGTSCAMATSGSSEFLSSTTPHCSPLAGMAPAKKKQGNGHKYSVILPTYNERQNIGIIVYLKTKRSGQLGGEDPPEFRGFRV